jgi:hypothetical protein
MQRDKQIFDLILEEQEETNTRIRINCFREFRW